MRYRYLCLVLPLYLQHLVDHKHHCHLHQDHHLMQVLQEILLCLLPQQHQMAPLHQRPLHRLANFSLITG